MGHQGQSPLQRLLGVFQLQMTVALGKGGEDFAEMAVHGREGLHERLLAQGGHRFDPQQQFLPLAVEHIQPFIELRQALFQRFQLFQGEHVHGFQRLHPPLDRLQFPLQGFEAVEADLIGDLRPGIRQGLLHLLQTDGSAALLFNQPLAFLPEALQVPFRLLQRLALATHLGFGGIPGAALFAEALLQIGLLLLQAVALLLQLLLLLPPGAMGGGQGLHRLLQTLFFRVQGLALVPQPLQGQLTLPFGIQQVIPLAAGGFQTSVGGLEILLELLPGRGVVIAAAVLLSRLQPLQLLPQRGQFQGDGVEALLLGGLIHLQLGQSFRPLTAAFQQGAVVAPGGIAFRHQGGLAFLQIAQLGFELLERLAQLGFLPPAGGQGLAQFQQPAPQRLSFVLIMGPTETESAVALGEAAAGHGAALFQQFTFEGHGPGSAQLLARAGQVAEHQGVAEHIGEHLVVHRFEAHQLHGPADQSSAVLPAATPATGAVAAGEGGATGAAARGADLVQGQEGETAGPPAFEQVDGAGGNAVVINDDLPQPGPGGDLQGESMAVLHFAELCHRSVDAIEPGLQQQPQGSGAAAFLQGIAAAFQPRDLALQTGLFLLQPGAGALLHRQGVGGLLNRLFAAGEGLQQGLPVLFQLLQPLLDRLFVLPVLALLLLQFHQPFRFLPQAFLQLLLFLLQGIEDCLQLLTAGAAAFLLLQPGTGAAGHIRQPPAGHLHRSLSGAAGLLRPFQGVVVGITLQLP